jgi:hypothetical protein
MPQSTWKLTLLLLAAGTQAGCFALPHKHNLPPAKMLMEPGPGVGGPGPGVLTALGGGAGGPGGPFFGARTSQVYFVGPEGTQVNWETGMGPGFDSEPLVTPGRQNFPQGAIYRLKLTRIPGRQGVELYPTVEIAPDNPRTEAFLAHNPIPVQFTEEDLDQVASSNFVTKVIYVPDPEFQDLAVANVETLVSTRLDPGVDPIAEADARGSILAIVRLGNIDLEVPDGMMMEGGVIQHAGYVAPPGTVVPAGFPGHHRGAIPAGPSHLGAPTQLGAPSYHGGPMPMAMGPVSGVNVPEWGMPYCGTPIGLPGPPHIPLGVEAGLQRHQIVNKTKVKLPNPVEHLKYTVKQSPGFSYPKPPHHVNIHEHSYAPGMKFPNPFWNKLQQAPTDASPGVVMPHHHVPGLGPHAASVECSDY